MPVPDPLEPLHRAVRRIAGPVRYELAESWRVALMLIVLATAGLAAAIPAVSLQNDASPTGTALGFDPLPGMGPVARWTDEMMPPGGVRDSALADLFPVLAALSWSVLGIAIVAMLGRLVAQSYERGPEIGVRRGVGAARRHIVSAQLIEAAMILGAILVAAAPVAYLLFAGAADAWPGPVSGARLAPSLPFAFVAGVLLLGALMPLAHRSARRLSGGDPMPVTLGLPALQIAGSVAVLTAAVAMLAHADRVAAGRAGAPPGAGAVLTIDPGLRDDAARAATYRSLLERLALDSRYQVASLASRGAHTGLGTVDFDVTDCGFCPRGQIVMRWLNLYATHHAITPDTFSAGGLSMVAGRELRLTDAYEAERVAVVNRHLAARYFERGEAVGRDIYVGTGWPRVPHRVVGVVDDDRPRVLGGAMQPRETVYLSALQHPPLTVELLVRGSAAPLDDQRVIAAMSGSARVARVGTETELAAANAEPLRWFGRWFGAAGLAALLVALTGTFDTVGLWVASVRGELAMRSATGATRRKIATYVATRVTIAVLAGIVAGVLLFTTLVRDYLTRSIPALPPWSAATVALTAALLLAAALASATVATRRFLASPPARWLG